MCFFAKPWVDNRPLAYDDALHERLSEIYNRFAAERGSRRRYLGLRQSSLPFKTVLPQSTETAAFFMRRCFETGRRQEIT
jgi:hypothetical protein